MPRPAALAAGPIDETPQHRKHSGRAVHLVQDDQLVEVLREEQFGMGQPSPATLGLEVQVQGRLRFRHLQGERGLARLPRSEERDGRGFLEGGLKEGAQAAG